MSEKIILLVEDNPDDEALTLGALKKLDIAHNIAVASDGAEARDYFAADGTFETRDRLLPPSLVLLDWMLPKVNGLEVLQHIRAGEYPRHVPVVVLTSSDEPDDLLAAYGNGANSYVRKPVDYLEFVNAVSRMGYYWLTLNKSPP